ncbi:MAG: hypothetical protein HZA31_06430 [Opitutae bacterium]|nr:hypothetical protein [Opitutae bacterium]
MRLPANDIAGHLIAPTLAPVRGWLSDLFRFYWGLFYWNIRKTVFRLRGGHCPCQSPSDSGKGGETQCEACLSWDRPKRFRRVCPLLIETPAGLRCAVDTAQVRPFWGRASAYWCGTLAAVYLGLVLAVFAGLRVIGYPVPFRVVAWPPAWHRINESRALYFLNQGRVALQNNRVREAVFALGIAYEIDPRNYHAGLILAQLWQTTQPQLSDKLYAQLLVQHPESGPATAQLWFRALLARGEFDRVRQLAAQQMQADPREAFSWLHAWLFAVRQSRDFAPLRDWLAQPQAVPPAWRALLTTELQLRTGQTTAALPWLRRVQSENAPYFAYYQIRQLLSLARAQEALSLIEAYGARLPDNDRVAFRLDAYALLGWSSLRRSDVELLLTAPPTPAVVDLLATHLVRHPDAELLAVLYRRVQQVPLPETIAGYRAYCALFCAVGMAKDAVKLREVTAIIQKRSGTNFRALGQAEEFFLGKSASTRLTTFLPVLTLPVRPTVPVETTLPLELTYALFEHYAPPVASAATPR